MQFKNSKLFAGILVGFFVAGTVFPSAVFANSDAKIVDRLAGNDRYETAIKVAEYGFPNGAETIILAPAMDKNLVDALTAAPLARAKNAPILLTQGNALTASTKEAIKALNEIKEIKNVIVVSKAIQEEVTNVIKEELKDNEELNIENIGGDDRYETAAKIAAELENVEDIFIAYGLSNADALSVASIAAAKGMPIILTNANSEIPAKEAEYLESIKDALKAAYIIGGEAVIEESVKDEIPGDDEIRVAGDDRYATNLEVLKKFTDLKFDQVYVANGNNKHLVDSLVASVVAAETESPIVLVNKNFAKDVHDFLKGKMPYTAQAIAIGGENLVAPEALDMNYVRAEDFVAAQFSVVNGYSVGFALTDAIDPLAIEKIEVSLYKGNDLLATNKSTIYTINHVYKGNLKLSTPFNINGDFEGDEYWENVKPFAGSILDIPTKAVITITTKEGKVYTAVNTNLTGDPDSLLAESKVIKATEFSVVTDKDANGFKVGFEFIDESKVADYSSIKVSLLDKDNNVFAVNKSTENLFVKAATDTELNTIFNIDDEDFIADGNWNYGEFDGEVTDVAKARIEVVSKAGVTSLTQTKTITGDIAVEQLTKAPEIASTLEGEVEMGVAEAVTIDITANKEANEAVKVIAEFTEGDVNDVVIELDGASFELNEEGYTQEVFADSKSSLSVTFNKSGDYSYTIKVVNIPAEGEDAVVYAEKSYDVKVVEPKADDTNPTESNNG